MFLSQRGKKAYGCVHRNIAVASQSLDSFSMEEAVGCWKIRQSYIVIRLSPLFITHMSTSHLGHHILCQGDFEILYAHREYSIFLTFAHKFLKSLFPLVLCPLPPHLVKKKAAGI